MKNKKLLLSALIAVICFATLFFAACNNNNGGEKSELQKRRESVIAYITEYPSTLYNPQIMTIFYRDIVDQAVDKINAAASIQEINDILSDFIRTEVGNIIYTEGWVTQEIWLDMPGMYSFSGSYEGKSYSIFCYTGTTLSGPSAPLEKYTVYDSEDPELEVKQMVITDNDVSQSEDFRPVSRADGPSGDNYAFPENTTHNALIMTKDDKIVGLFLQTMLIGGGNDVSNKFLVSGTFQTPVSESEVKTYIQTVIDGKTPPADNKLSPQNAAAVYSVNMRLPLYVVAENNAHKFEYAEGSSQYTVGVYSDTPFLTDENGASVNQKTLSAGESFTIRDDFPVGEYIIVTVAHAAGTEPGEGKDTTFVFQMQPLDEDIYAGGGKQLTLVATCYSNFKYRSGPISEHDTLYALAVGKYLVNQLKSGVSPENLTIG